MDFLKYKIIIIFIDKGNFKEELALYYGNLKKS